MSILFGLALQTLPDRRVLNNLLFDKAE